MVIEYLLENLEKLGKLNWVKFKTKRIFFYWKRSALTSMVKTRQQRVICSGVFPGIDVIPRTDHWRFIYTLDIYIGVFEKSTTLNNQYPLALGLEIIVIPRTDHETRSTCISLPHQYSCFGGRAFWGHVSINFTFRQSVETFHISGQIS